MQTKATDTIPILFINNGIYKSGVEKPDTPTAKYHCSHSHEFIGESELRKKIMFFSINDLDKIIYKSSV